MGRHRVDGGRAPAHPLPFPPVAAEVALGLRQPFRRARVEHVAAMDEPEQATREDRLVVVAVERIGAGRRADKEPGVEELYAGEHVGRGCRRPAPAEAPVAIAEEVTRAPAPQRARQGAEEEERIHRFSVPRLGKTLQRRRAAGLR